MGSSMKKLASYFSKHDEIHILVNGLDAAGKTTIFYKIQLTEVVTTIPTIGFNVETITHDNLILTAWDVGGRYQIRALWVQYYQNASAVVFVVDSNDRDRLGEACEQLYKMVDDDLLKGKPVLILANKQDLPNALTMDEIKEKLNPSKLDERKIKWHIQPTIALQNQGILEGFEWIANALKPETDLTQSIKETVLDLKTMANNLSDVWNTVTSKTFLS